MHSDLPIRWRIPLSRPDAECALVEPAVRRSFDRILRRRVFRDGPELAGLETELASAFQQKHAIAVSSGGLALTIALRAAGVSAGDEVITVSNMDVSLSAPITHAGGEIRWVDVDAATLTLDPKALETAVSPRTRAIVVVHLFGNPADLTAILAVGRRCGVTVIEDASHGPGATYLGSPCGSWADIAVLSLTGGKPLGAAGLAGVILTRDAAVADRSRCLANYGLRPADLDDIHRGDPNAKFRAKMEGYNGILDEWQSAVLRTKLQYLDRWVAIRREQAAQYRDGLAGCSPRDIQLQDVVVGGQPALRHFVVRSPRRTHLQSHLQRVGIASVVRYSPPLHKQAVYSGLRPVSLPETERAARRSVCLPLHPTLTSTEIDTVIGSVKAFALARSAGRSAFDDWSP